MAKQLVRKGTKEGGEGGRGKVGVRKDERAKRERREA